MDLYLCFSVVQYIQQSFSLFRNSKGTISFVVYYWPITFSHYLVFFTEAIFECFKMNCYLLVSFLLITLGMEFISLNCNELLNFLLYNPKMWFIFPWIAIYNGYKTNTNIFWFLLVETADVSWLLLLPVYVCDEQNHL